MTGGAGSVQTFGKEFAVLVLSRKKDEVLCIGDHIRVLIVEIRGDKVRIGIEAPREIAVDRLEIRESKLRDRESTP
jgi:carbon storage regulator